MSILLPSYTVLAFYCPGEDLTASLITMNSAHAYVLSPLVLRQLHAECLP